MRTKEEITTEVKRKIEEATPILEGLLKTNESIGVDMLFSTYKKAMSLHKKYDELSDVIDDAVNVLVRGPTVRNFIDYLDLFKNVIWTQGFGDIDTWIEHIERTCSEEELKTVYILDYIHCLETEEEAFREE